MPSSPIRIRAFPAHPYVLGEEPPEQPHRAALSSPHATWGEPYWASNCASPVTVGTPSGRRWYVDDGVAPGQAASARGPAVVVAHVSTVRLTPPPSDIATKPG